MEPYARAYLHLMTSAVASGAPAEAFVFATRLTRLTRALGGRNPELAIQRAAAAAPDWSSGTRIGEALRTFNDRYGRRGMARGAVVVILSDGWERADPASSGARWSGWRGSRTGSSGSTRASAPPASPRPRAAWRRPCRTATRWSAATASTPSTRSPRRWPEAISDGRVGELGAPRRRRGRGAVVAERRADRGAAAGADAERLRPQARQDDLVRSSPARRAG